MTFVFVTIPSTEGEALRLVVALILGMALKTILDWIMYHD